MALRSCRQESRNATRSVRVGVTFIRRMLRRVRPYAIKLAAACVIVAPSVANEGAAPVSVNVSPATIEMRTFYNGADVRVEGSAPAGSDVLVIVRGAAKDEFFNRKGRKGPIWVNADKLKISGAPSLFLSFSSRELNSILDRPSINEHKLDELSIKNGIQCVAESGSPDKAYLETIRSNYLKLKGQEGSYRAISSSVKLSEAASGARQYRLEIPWPRKAPPGSYHIEVYACRNRAVIGRAEAPLRLVEAGFPAWVAALSHDHSFLYGLLAVIAATIAGFGINALASLFEPRKKVPAEGMPIPEPQNAMAAKASAGRTQSNGPDPKKRRSA